MQRLWKFLILFLLLIGAAFLGFTYYKNEIYELSNFRTAVLPKCKPCKGINVNEILKKANGIMLMETTDRMEPSSLVLCSLESTARVYPDRPVVYFMKGLGNITTWKDQRKARKRFPVLSAFHNIYLFPLRMEDLLDHTPLIPWYKKTDPKKEKYWIHVASDACRLALMWRYGGMYMDTDIISIRPIHLDNFVVGELPTATSCSVFALPPFHNLTWEFMKNFVENYNGNIWAHQGPGVFTRVIKKMCGLPDLTSKQDMKCGNLPYLHPQRFYPYIAWWFYSQVLKVDPTFNTSYGLHQWNFQSGGKNELVPGRNTLREHLYQKYCPTTYKYVVKKSKEIAKKQTKV